MRAIVVLRPREGVGLGEFGPHLLAEERVPWSHLQAGTRRAIHHVADRPGTIQPEFETAAAEEVRPLVDALPIVRAGLLDVEVLPLAPHAGLATLFAEEHGTAPRPIAPRPSAARAGEDRR